MAFPLDEKYVAAAEQKSGASLPSAYREAMMEMNGGNVQVNGDVWWLHPIQDMSDKKRIKRTCNHILLETQNSKNWQGFPDDVLDIGHNGSGDVLVLKKNGDAWSDEVFVFDHETSALAKADAALEAILATKERA